MKIRPVLMLVPVVILIALGCMVEATSLVIILAPMLAATGAAEGIDQLHMALVPIFALMLGLFTPPVGPTSSRSPASQGSR